jgi:hypothetical protein
MAADGASAPTALADAAFAATAEVYAGTPGSWAEGVGAAIAALFDFLAARPDAVAGCVLAESGQDDRTLERFTALLAPGFETAPEPPPPVVAEAVGSAILELVRLHAVEGRLAELPHATADAIVVALVPFVGVEAANALARSTSRAD